jgi:preprotein translocase subunit SecD
MKIRFSFLVFFIFLFGLILIDLPENYHVDFTLGNIHFKKTINPIKIKTSLFGHPISKDFTTKLGLDLKGGSHLVFDAKMDKIKTEDREDALASARDVIEKRINFFGVSEPSIQTSKSNGQYRIIIDLPGIKNVNEAVNLIGKTAQLQFKEVQEEKVGTESAITLKDTPLNGTHVKKASVQFDTQSGKPSVNLEFDTTGAKLFEDITGRNIGKPVLILLDNQILTQPVVQQQITGGQAAITGSFTVDQAKELSVSINSGALPVPISLVEERSIGATLGNQEVHKSMVAGLIGLSAVIFFMIAYYGRLGILASVALIIYGLINMAIFRAIPITLTLPGIAGFILSIGMAVDSNILIFERIKEEQRKGKDFNSSIRLGFGHAIDAIKDANITTLLVAFILFNPLNWSFFPQFGLVKGFALTLAIGVATSLFTGVVITKRLIQIFYKEKKHDTVSQI